MCKSKEGGEGKTKRYLTKRTPKKDKDKKLSFKKKAGILTKGHEHRAGDFYRKRSKGGDRTTASKNNKARGGSRKTRRELKHRAGHKKARTTIQKQKKRNKRAKVAVMVGWGGSIGERRSHGGTGGKREKEKRGCGKKKRLE